MLHFQVSMKWLCFTLLVFIMSGIERRLQKVAKNYQSLLHLHCLICRILPTYLPAHHSRCDEILEFFGATLATDPADTFCTSLPKRIVRVPLVMIYTSSISL